MELLSENYLMHYGVKGQKYGQRRYQNPDGSLTPEGREHYGVGEKESRTIGGISDAIKNNRRTELRNNKKVFKEMRNGYEKGTYEYEKYHDIYKEKDKEIKQRYRDLRKEFNRSISSTKKAQAVGKNAAGVAVGIPVASVIGTATGAASGAFLGSRFKTPYGLGTIAGGIAGGVAGNIGSTAAATNITRIASKNTKMG